MITLNIGSRDSFTFVLLILTLKSLEKNTQCHICNYPFMGLWQDNENLCDRRTA